MSTLNPESTDKIETKPEDENKEAPEDKALDHARQLAKGEIKFEDIEDEELLKEIHQRFAIEEEEIPEVGEKPAEEEPEATVEKPGGESEPESKVDLDPAADPADDSQEVLQQRKSAFDELNTIQQKIDAKQKRLDELNDLGDIPKSKKHEDVTSEEAIEDTNSRLSKIEKQQSDFFKGQKESLAKDTQDLKREKLYLELTNFQLNNAGLKTSKPVNVLNAQYKNFVERIGGMDNVDKFLADKQFRETKEAEGHSFPMSDDDYKKFDTISKINAFKNSRKYPTLTAAFHDYQRENGIVLDQVKTAALKAAKDTLEGVGGEGGGATTLSPEAGSAGTGKAEMSEKDMETWLIGHPNPITKEDIKKAEEIHNILMKRGR